MAIRKPLALMVAAAIAFAAPMAHAGKDTVPSAATVFSPAFTAVLATAFAEIRAGTAAVAIGTGGTGTVTLTSGAVVTVNADRTVTVTLASGASTTFTSGFIASFFSAYL